MLLCIFAVAIVLVRAKELNASFTSQETIEQQIEAAIRFMCTNQYDTNGRFLYTGYLKKDEIEVDPLENNMPRQAGGFLAIGMYYRLNYHNNNNKIDDTFSITHCIDNSIRYLTNMSNPIIFPDHHQHHHHHHHQHIKNQNVDKQNGELIDGNTGATSLGILGMIETCIVDHNICKKNVDQFILWMNGLITMRNHKFEHIDDAQMKDGAFSRKLTSPSKSSNFYDGEGYLAFTRMIKYKEYLYPIIGDKLDWNMIVNITNGLDEYFIQHQHQQLPHWFVQSWFDRWVTFNSYLPDNVVNNFQNEYMVSELMKTKLEDEFERLSKYTHYKSQAKCFLFEATIDVIYAVNVTINNKRYKNSDSIASLELFQNDLWDKVKEKYAIITKKQLFKDKVDFYFESRFDGAILTDDEKLDYFRVDDTQHCVCMLMKLNSLLYHTNTNDMMGYYDNIDPLLFVDAEADIMYNNAVSQNYDLMISLICLLVVIILVYFIFFYWCYYYPKEQKIRNDLLWMEKKMESVGEFDDSDADEDTEFIAA